MKIKYLSKYFPNIIFFTIGLLIFVKCANQLPPGGGEVDTVPPKIIEVSPLDRTTNYDKDFFEIVFSEYVDKRSVQEAIFISPPISKGLTYDWSGRSLSVYFNDSLKQNATYTITIGAGVQDLNNRNKMNEPFTFAFSTGSIIDTGKISGKIYNDDPSGVMVYAFYQKDTIANPMTQKPDYVSQVGKNGKFNLPGLSNGKYNVYSFRDKYQDFLYQRNEDEFGVQFKGLNITNENTEIVNTDFFLSMEDTLAPKLSSVVMKDRSHFILEFNEVLDSMLVTRSNFFLYDSTEKKQILPKYFFKGDARVKQFYLSLGDSLTSGNDIYLHSDGIIDKNSNKSGEEVTSITVKNDLDTIPPKILKITGTLPGDKVDYDLPVLSVKFDDGFDQENVSSAIQIKDNKNNLAQFEMNMIDDASFNIHIKNKLKQRTDYKMLIDLSKIVDASGNKVDSIYTHKFTTASELDFSGVSGSVVSNADSSNIYVVLTNASTEKKVYKQKVSSQMSFNINKVLPGKYLLWSFIDKNNDQNYSSGSVKPLKYAEMFKFYPDTLNLRARWPVGDVIIRYE